MFLSAALITTLYKSRFRNTITNSTGKSPCREQIRNKELTVSEVLALWGYVRTCIQVT